MVGGRVWVICVSVMMYLQVAFGKADDILVLKTTEFDTSLAAYPRLLVLFEAGWCPTSSSALNLLQDLVHQQSELLTALGVKVGKVTGADHSEADDFRRKLGIEEYPHISLFLHGAQIRYLSQIDDLKSLISFLNDNAHSDSREATLEGLRHTLSDNENRILLFTGRKGHPRFSVFLEACLYFKDVTCYHGDEHSVIDEWKLSLNQMYILSKSEVIKQYRAGWRREKIFEWVHQHSSPPFAELSDSYSQRILGEQTPALILIFGPKDQPEQEAKEDAKLLEFLKQNPSLYNTKYLTAHCSQDSLSCQNFLAKLPVQFEHPSLFVTLFHPNSDDPLIFVYKNTDLHLASLRSWLSDIQQGRILMETRSEPVEVQKDGIMKIGYDGLRSHIGGEKDLLIIFGDDSYFRSDVWVFIREYLTRFNSLLQQANYSSITIAFFNKQHNSVYGLNLQDVPEARFYRQGEAKVAGQISGSKLQAASLIELIEDLATHPLPTTELGQTDM